MKSIYHVGLILITLLLLSSCCLIPGNCYNVSFVSNGGTDIPDQLVYKNSHIIKPIDPQKDGYVFLGWYTDSELMNEWDFSQQITEDITLYAKFIKQYRILFINSQIENSFGWAFEHDQGRKYVEEEFGDKINITIDNNISPDATSINALSNYAAQGFDMIIGTSFELMDYMKEVALDFPNTLFEHCSGYKTLNNMSTYFGRMYQARYLSGMVAGSMTNSNIIGYVAAYPIPEVIRGINAFTLGAQLVNPNVQIHIIWSFAWADPIKERAASLALINVGADILTYHQDSMETLRVAQENEILSIGYGSDMSCILNDSVLVSPMWNWKPYYKETIENGLAGLWEEHQFWGGFAEDAIKISDFSPLVPSNVKTAVMNKQLEFSNNSWDVFTGPIYDNEDNLVVPADSMLNDNEILSMAFYVKGVIY